MKNISRLSPPQRLHLLQLIETFHRIIKAIAISALMIVYLLSKHYQWVNKISKTTPEHIRYVLALF
jgi:hypothetical protein